MGNILFETYLQNTQKDLFIIALKSEYDVFSFIKAYMKSDICEQIDSPSYSFWQHQTPDRIFDEIISSYKISKKRNNVNINAIEWLGFFYRKWHFITGDSSKKILRYLSPEQGVKQFFELHQIDEREAIERVKSRYNLSRNAHRKYEAKKIDYRLFNYEDEKYYSYLAKNILFRLTRENKYLRLEINNNSDSRLDLISPIDKLGVDIKVVRSKTLFSNIGKLLSLDKRTSNEYITILFCFVLYKEDERELENIINVMRLKNSAKSVAFDYIYLYSQGALFEINQSNEINKYYLPLSLKEDIGINRKIKK